MTFEVEDQAGATIVRLHGELVGGQVKFVEAVTSLLTQPGARVLLDLGDVPFMNSIGLSELVRITAQANVQEGRIVLVRPSPFVAGVLQTTQLVRFFDVSPTIEAALQKLS